MSRTAGARVVDPAGEQGPVGREAMARLAEGALDRARPGWDVEVLLTRDVGGLTRFADGQVHQHVATEDWSANVRAVCDDGRAGVVTVHTDDPAQVADAADRALDTARQTPPDPDFPGLAPWAPVAEGAVDAGTATASPTDRSAVVRTVLDGVGDPRVAGGLSAAGSVRSGLGEVSLLTSVGQHAHAARTTAELVLVVTGQRSSGYAQAGGPALSDIDAAPATRRAVDKARAGRNPVAVEAGGWPVVLEPPGVASLTQFLAFLGFGAKAYQEGRAFSSGQLGAALFDPRLTLRDDAYRPTSPGLPFDGEGTPRQQVDLVRDGTVAGIVHDRRTGRRAGVPSTGHALPAPNTMGPLPLDPALEPGADGSVDDLVRGMDHGLLVTRLHYVNVAHVRQARLTGMTRDGTFLVEDGRVTKAVHNLRLTASLLETLARVRGVSSETGWGSDLLFGGAQHPALALDELRFTGTTSFG